MKRRLPLAEPTPKMILSVSDLRYQFAKCVPWDGYSNNNWGAQQKYLHDGNGWISLTHFPRDDLAAVSWMQMYWFK